MARRLLLYVLGAFVVSLQFHETEAQRSRVCFAQSGDYSTNTAMGFCSQAIYMALTPTSRGLLGLVNPANDADDILGGIKKFTSRKTTYTYLELYLGMVGSVSAGNIAWLSNPTTRTSFIQLVVDKLKVYPEMTGLYVDFEGMTSTFTANYAAFLTSLKTELDKINVKLATALPYDALTYAGVYYNTVLPTLPFNVLKTYEDMYATSTTVTHPMALLYSLTAPFNVDSKTISNNVFRWVIAGLPTTNIILGLPMYSLKFTASGATNFNGAATALVKDTYCNALLFGSTNTVGASQAGEGFAYSASTFYTYNTFASVNDKLSFATATNLGGVALYSLDQAGSTNAELLRYTTSVLAPAPPTGATYPAAEPATCGVPITFPVPPTTTTTTTPTTTTTTTTTTPTTTTTTTTPTTTTTTTTPTTTTTTTTPTTTTTTTTPTTTSTTTTPTTTSTTTTPTTTSTTTTPTTTSTTTTPTTTSTTTTPTTTSTTTTPTTTSTTTTPTTTSTTTTPTTTSTTTTPTTTSTTTTPTTTSTTTTPTTTSTTTTETTTSTTTTPTTTSTTTTPTTTSTTTTPTTTSTTTTPTTTSTTTTPTTTSTTTTPTTTSTTTTPTTTSTTTTPTTTSTTTTPTTTSTTTTPTTTSTTTTPTTTSTTTTPTTTSTTTTPTTTSTTTTPTTTSTTTIPTTTTVAPVSAVVCDAVVRPEYGNLVSEYCAALKAISTYINSAGTCGVVA